MRTTEEGKRSLPPEEATLDFASATAFACLVFACAYALFRVSQPWIVGVPKSLGPEDFMPWARWAVAEQDGRELPVAFMGMLACSVGCFVAAQRGIGRRIFSSKPVRWACYGAAALVLSGIRSTEFSMDGRASWVLLAVAGVLLATAWLTRALDSWRRPTAARDSSRNVNLPLDPSRKLNPKWRAVATVLFAALVVIVLLFTAGDASVTNYGYFIGPALEWMHGESLGSFYMQYSLLGLLITSGFMRLGLHVNGMQLALAGLAIGWFGLYWWLSREWIRDRTLRALFLVCLLAFRVLWMRCHIAAEPQTAPFRMDLWVPLVLVARKKGLTSPWTAGCFAAAYALDAFFGLLYLAVYLASAAFALREMARHGGLRASTAAAVFAPAVLAGSFNLFVFGSLVASSATHYLDVKLGFLPISPTSLFWAVLLILLLCAVIFARAGSERRFGAFLVLIAVVQETYFLGRSHDHNLVNIGGSWLFVAFAALDVARLETPRFARSAASVLVVGCFVLGAGRIVGAVGRSFDKLAHQRRFPENDFDRRLDATRSEWPTNAANVILLGPEDAYMNYRLGLRQHGYYSPIFAHLLLEETSGWLYGEMEQANRVLVPANGPMVGRELDLAVHDMNHSRFMTDRSASFVVKPSASTAYYELAISH